MIERWKCGDRSCDRRMPEVMNFDHSDWILLRKEDVVISLELYSNPEKSLKLYRSRTCKPHSCPPHNTLSDPSQGPDRSSRTPHWFQNFLRCSNGLQNRETVHPLVSFMALVILLPAART
jgi:hypothetical protein